MDKTVLNKLQALCAKREYCSSEILRKALDRLDGDAGAAQEMLASLVEDGFVSDRRYACAFAREKSALQGWGPVKIRYALAAKKISREDIDAALEETDREKAREKLVRLLELKSRSLEGDPDKKLKLIKYGLTRGYGYEDVQEALASLGRPGSG